MGHYIVGVVFWILDIRGHIPQFGGHHPSRNNASAGTGLVSRIVAGFLVSVALLALALWAAVWLAIRLL